MLLGWLRISSAGLCPKRFARPSLGGIRPAIMRMQLSGPERLVIDLDGKWQVKAPGVPKNPAVTNVRIGKGDDKTRIVIDLTGKIQPKFTLSKDGHTLDIRLDH